MLTSDEYKIRGEVGEFHLGSKASGEQKNQKLKPREIVGVIRIGEDLREKKDGMIREGRFYVPRKTIKFPHGEEGSAENSKL